MYPFEGFEVDYPFSCSPFSHTNPSYIQPIHTESKIYIRTFADISFSRYNDFKNRHGGILNMSTKSQTVFAICFGLFLAVVVTVSLLFADRLPYATQPEGITGGYLFSFNVECVDERGNLLKTQKLTGNGTLWSF